MNLNFNLKTRMEGFYTVRLRTPYGRIVPFKGHENPEKNIITDNGKDSVFARTYLASMAYLVIGKGNTEATTSDASLQTYYATSNLMSSSENGTVSDFSGRYKDIYRTFYWTNSTGSSQTIYELGITWLDTSNPAVFSRIVIADGLTIPNGYDLVVKYTLRLHVANWRTPQSVNLTYFNGTTDVEQSGTLMYVCNYTASNDTILSGIAYPNAQGNDMSASDPSRVSLLEPSRLTYGAGSDTYARFCTDETQFSGLLTAIGNLPYNPAITTNGLMGLSTYTAGSFTRTKSFKLNAASYPETPFRSFIIGNSLLIYPGLIWDSDASFIKDSSHSWTAGITYTVDRA